MRARDTLHWDVLRLYGDVLDGLRAAARDAGAIDSVAVDSWGVDFALLDRKGRLLAEPRPLPRPRRAARWRRLLERVPARELYERTGIQLMPINTVFELAAMAAEGDPVLDARRDAAAHARPLPLLALRAARTTEFTNATTTQCFDPRGGGWATDLLDRLDVPRGCCRKW